MVVVVVVMMMMMMRRSACTVYSSYNKSANGHILDAAIGEMAFQRSGQDIYGSFRPDLIDVKGLLTIRQGPDYPSAQGNSNWVLRWETRVDIEGASHPQRHCIYLPVHQHPRLQKHAIRTGVPHMVGC